MAEGGSLSHAAPTLLQFPDSINKSNSLQLPPKLLTISLPVFNKDEEEIRVDSSRFPGASPVNTVRVPKLIDLRTVLKLNPQQKKNAVPSPKLLKLPQLVDNKPHFPEIPVKFAPPELLFSPRRIVVDVRKQPEDGKIELIDMRPNAEKAPPQLINIKDAKKPFLKAIPIEEPVKHLQESHKIVDAINVPIEMQSTKQRGNLVVKTDLESSCKHCRKKPADRSADESTTPDTTPVVSRRKPRRQRHNKENEIYEAISYLLKKQKKRRTNRRLRLYDIIDNIPLSSDSESEDGLLNYKHLLSKRYKLPAAEKPTPFVENAPKAHQSEKRTYVDDDGLPNVVKGANDRLAKYFDPSVSSADPVSWLNIIRASQHDTKHTQTNVMPGNITKECQTELAEMSVVPRTQTFFFDTKDAAKEKENTDMFCARIRQEVLEKLGAKQPLQDKMSQTVTNASMQTDDDDSFTQRTVISPAFQHKPTKLSDASIGVPKMRSPSPTPVSESRSTQTPRRDVITPTLPSNFQENLTLNCNTAGSHFLDVVDISDDDKSVMLPSPIASKEKFCDGENIISPTVAAVIITSPDIDVVKNSVATNVRRRNELENEEDANDGHGRLGLKENLNEFSFGLKALEDLHENLEVELKQSKSLFNSILTIHDGYTRKPPQEPIEETKEDALRMLSDHYMRTKADLNEANLSEATLSVNHPMNSARHSPRQERIHSPYACGRDFADAVNTSAFRGDGLVTSQRGDVTPRVDFNDRLTSSRAHYSPREVHLDPQDEEIKDKLRRKYRGLSPESSPKVEKRSKLLAWMKNKREERQATYRQQQEDKRACERQPSVSKNNFTAKYIRLNTTLQEERKRMLFQENNAERIRAAERLANAITNSPRIVESGPRRNEEKLVLNDRYKTIPIRDTRTSRIRKNAVFTNLLKTYRKREPKKKNPRKFADGKRRSVGYDVTGRRSVEPRDFVTKDTFYRFQAKSKRKLRETVKMFSTDVDSCEENLIWEEECHEPLNVESIMKNYGVHDVNNVSSELALNSNPLKNTSSETTKLLEEVDFALLVEDEADIVENEAIDWDEVDKILNTS